MYYINIHTWTLRTIVMPLPVRRKQWPHGSHKTSDIGPYSTSFCPSGSFSWIPIDGRIYLWEDRNPMDEARLLRAWRKIFHTILMSDWCDNSLQPSSVQPNRSSLNFMYQALGNKMELTLNAYYWLIIMIRGLCHLDKARHLLIKQFLLIFFYYKSLKIMSFRGNASLCS